MGVDYLGQLTHSIYAFVLNNDNLFSAFAQNEWRNLAVIMIVIYGLKWMASPGPQILPEAMGFATMLIITKVAIYYYAQPMPWGHSSLVNLFPDTFTALSSQINLAVLDQANAALNTAINNMEKPDFWQVGQIVVYWVVTFLISCLQAVLFIVTSIGFVGVGLMAVVGQMFIPWLIVPRMSFLFWNWLMAIIKYSFYQVMGAALAVVWSTVVLLFCSQTMNGAYDLAHMVTLVGPLIVLNAGMAFSCLYIGHYVNDLFSGGATAGAGFGSAVSRILR